MVPAPPRAAPSRPLRVLGFHVGLGADAGPVEAARDDLGLQVRMAAKDVACCGVVRGGEGEGGRAPFGRGSRFQDAFEIMEGALVREGADAAPELRTDRPPGRPPLMGVVDENGRKLGVGPFVEALDRPQLRADEQRLEHHLVPGAAVEHLGRIRVAVGDRLEDRLDPGADPFGRPADQELGRREQRKPAIDGDELAEIGRPAQRFDRLREGVRVAVAREEKRDAGRLIEGQAGRVEAGANLVGLPGGPVR